MDDKLHGEWRAAFYAITHNDPQALRDPGFKPRGTRRHGPFATYANALLYAQDIHCTHYSVDKVYVAPNIHPPFLDHKGNREQDPIPGV